MIFYLLELYIGLSAIIILIKVLYYSKESSMRMVNKEIPFEKVKLICRNLQRER